MSSAPPTAPGSDTERPQSPVLSSARVLAEQALDRASGVEPIAGNQVDLLIDGQAHFDAWLAAIRSARKSIFLENYIIRDDEVGRAFIAALAERAALGVRVAVIRDWLGCLGYTRAAFWRPLLDAGGEVRVYNPPRLDSPFGWLSRDHRKLLVVDGAIGFVSGVCLSQKWLGDPKRDIAPWRDTGVAMRGPACAELERAFKTAWARLGTPVEVNNDAPAPVGDIDVRVIVTE